MGKKRQRAHQVSKGQRKSQDPRWTKEARREWVGSTAQLLAKVEAFKKNKRVRKSGFILSGFFFDRMGI